MPINLNNVNIPLRQFQAVSIGDHNAGEVKLVDENTIDKVNHHVSWRSQNDRDFSHEEVLAIKNAFVRALSTGGVGPEGLNRVREELGLQPMNPVDTSLHARSIKPLSRLQIRQILDRYADAINQGPEGVIIRHSNEIYARVGANTLQTRREERDRANAELSSRRSVTENRQINLVQSVLAGDVDFYDDNMRTEMLNTAKQCLESVLRDCRAEPRGNKTADIKLNLSEGKNVVLSSGLSEVDLVHKLEDIIVRLSVEKAPAAGQLTVRNEFKALASPTERTVWAAGLTQNPQGAVKARVVAVMIMQDHGIGDEATLSVVNKLSDQDVITLVTGLAPMGDELTGAQLRESAALQFALASANPDRRLNESEMAYIPALSDERFNQEIANGLTGASENLPFTYQFLLGTTAATMRARYGELGYADDATSASLMVGTDVRALTGANNPNAPRITAEALRNGLMTAELRAGAWRVFEAGVISRLSAAGLNETHPQTVQALLNARQPAILQRILTAESPAAADAVLNDYTAQIAECARDVRLAANQDQQPFVAVENQFLAGDGAARALQAGFAQAELPKIARAFALYKLVTNATDEAALAAALDPDSKVSRLASYGGRFTANLENFKAGLKLMEEYTGWFKKMFDNINAGNFTTLTERYLHTGTVGANAARALESFLFAEIAINDSIPLDVQKPENVFGMANNPAMRFVGNGYTTSCAYTLAQVPPEKRQIIYAVFNVFDPQPADKDKKVKRDRVGQSGVLLARILKHYDAVVEFRDKGQLDRTHLVPLLYREFTGAPTASNSEIDSALSSKLFSDVNLINAAFLHMAECGATVDEVLAALRQGRRLPNAPYVTSYNGHFEGLNGTAKEGRETMVGDLIRPTGPNFVGNGAPTLLLSNVKYTVHFPDGTTLDSRHDKNGKEDVNAAVAAIADKIETVCGKVHQRQLNSVYFSLSQSALGSKIRGGFYAQGIDSNEHMALTFTLVKDANSGDVTIRYSEPTGFPLHFSWETTVHIDGSSESTNMVVEVPPGMHYKALPGANSTDPFSSSTVVAGTGPAATMVQNIINTRCGAPEDASPTEKANAFVSTVNTFATNEMACTLGKVVGKFLLPVVQGQRRENFDGDHEQFKRDLKGKYRFHFPGVKGHSTDYATNRDHLLRFLTGNENATFDTATVAEKRRLGILMSMLTQYTSPVAEDAVAGATALPGADKSFMTVADATVPDTGADLTLSKDADGNIKINLTMRISVSMVISYGENNAMGDTVMVGPGSYYACSMDINLPKDNLDALADADWSQYDYKTTNDFVGTMEARVQTIPEQYRFKGTVNLAYHLHLNEPAPHAANH